ncbi:MAG TPA: class I SAM-dependent methyltransferase [Ilumatobacteraceae bacterium]|nr:class I SAM-dependent methyltransferase [Ilumatobacteraceae bacterium]
MTSERWNSNLHAFERLLELVPAGAMRGLDVGCGEGETSRRLRRRVPCVTGLDTDVSSIECARRRGDDIDYVVGDLFGSEVEESAFDVVTAVAVLHHVDHRRALVQLSRFVRPGGVLLAVGLARSRSAGDYARDVVDTIAVRRHTFVREVWHTPAPQVWPPPLTYTQTREVSMEALPGAAFERVPFFRYTITWTRQRG